jgi:hypothetical protein
MEAMAHATLIPPAQEPKAPPPLDTSKPMRLKTDHAPVRYLDTGVHGDIWCRTQEGIVCSFKPDALENIPTLKRTMTRDVVMVEGIGSLILGGEFCKNKIIARGTITLTEGDGL